MTATFLTAAFSSMARGLPFRHRLASIDLSRLSAHDLADLNLPSEVRSRVDLQREGSHWDRASSLFGR